MQEAACKRLVLPTLSMGAHCNGLSGKLENVLKRAARFMTRHYSCSGICKPNSYRFRCLDMLN